MRLPYLAVPFLLAVCLMPASGADVMPTATELRDRAKAGEGPEPINVRETIVATGSLGDTKTVTYKSGDDVRTIYERGGLHSETGTRHGESWRQNFNGLTVLVEKDPGAEAPEPITTTVTRVSQPFDAYVVSALNVRGAGTRTFYDPSSFRVRRTESVGFEGTIVRTNDEFGTFGAQTLVKKWTVSSKDSGLEMHYERAEFLSGAVTDTDVREASTRRTLPEFPSDVDHIDITPSMLSSSVLVRVNFGSRAVDFMLDSGASGIVLDPLLAKDLGLTLINASQEVAVQRFTSYNAVVPDLRVGALRMHDIVVQVAPIPNIGPESSVKILGLLGFDFLAQLGVTIDYQHKNVRIVRAENFDPPAATTYAVDVRLGAGVPMATVSVSGAIAERMIFDTGCACEFGFFDYFARRYPKSFINLVGVAHMSGVGGTFAAGTYRLHDIKLGVPRFDNPVVMRIPGSTYGYQADGLMGNEIFALFTLSLDYTNGRIYLTPNSAARAAQEQH